MSSILDRIFEVKRRRVADAKRLVSVEEMRELGEAARRDATPHRFVGAMQQTERFNVIAEFKKASPSKGVLNAFADPAVVGALYQNSGAAAISVLTEEDHFQGSLDDLVSMRSIVNLPILRKDFVFDEFQVYESANAGADAILLIASSLETASIRELRSIAEDELGLDALVEVHSAEEMGMAIDAGANLIGVNNRNLRTFDVTLDVSRELVKLAPKGATLVAESGITKHEDLVELSSLGYSGFLIGETLMRSGDTERELRELARIPSV